MHAVAIAMTTRIERWGMRTNCEARDTLVPSAKPSNVIIERITVLLIPFTRTTATWSRRALAASPNVSFPYSGLPLEYTVVSWGGPRWFMRILWWAVCPPHVYASWAADALAEEAVAEAARARVRSLEKRASWPDDELFFMD